MNFGTWKSGWNESNARWTIISRSILNIRDMPERFFQSSEFECHCGRPECTAPKAPTPELLTRLNTMRMLLGFPIVIASGNRCRFWNTHEGGTDNSEHLIAEGADLKCLNSVDRWRMVEAATQAGFERLGIGKTFLHVGVSKSLAPKVIWTYYS